MCVFALYCHAADRCRRLQIAAGDSGELTSHAVLGMAYCERSEAVLLSQAYGNVLGHRSPWHERGELSPRPAHRRALKTKHLKHVKNPDRWTLTSLLNSGPLSVFSPASIRRRRVEANLPQRATLGMLVQKEHHSQ